MAALNDLYKLAGEINQSWVDLERVNWSEAEQLVRECKEIPSHMLSLMPMTSEALAYADEAEDWDSGYVGEWPEIIQCEIEGLNNDHKATLAQHVDSSQTSLVLAALRHLQTSLDSGLDLSHLKEIFDLQTIASTDIDVLCEQINTDDPHQDETYVPVPIGVLEALIDTVERTTSLERVYNDKKDTDYCFDYIKSLVKNLI